MKKLILVTALAAVFAGGAMADTTPVTSGKITFKGKITDQTCSVDTDDQNKVVVLNAVPKSVFSSTSKTAMPTPFTIHLKGCQTTAVTNNTLLRVKAAFYSDNADSANDYALKNKAGGAEGVFIQLFNKDGTTAITPSASGTVTLRTNQTGEGLSDGVEFETISGTDMNLHYIAKYYVPSGTAGAGDVESSVNFNIVYD